MGEIRKLLGGFKEPLEWVLKGYKPVDGGLAASRAAVCLTCPLNGVGPLTEFFTKRAAATIKKSLELRHTLNMETPFDASLGICEVCNCPLPLKVHEPLDLIRKHLKPKTKKALWYRCWILRELDQNENETTHAK